MKLTGKIMMRGIAISFAWCVLSVPGIAQPGPAPEGTTPTTPAQTLTMPKSVEEAAFVITVQNIPGLIDKVGMLAGQITPIVNGAMIKAQIGQTLGDPSLAGLPAGSGAAMVLFPNGVKTIILSVAPDYVTSYSKSLNMIGQQTAVQDGLIVVAPDPDGLKAGGIVASQVKAKYLGLGQKDRGDVDLIAYPPKVVETYDPMVQMMLGSLASNMAGAGQTAPDTQAAARQSEAFLRIYYSIFKQTDQLHLKLMFDAGGLRVETIASPKAGSNLSAFFAAPVQSSANLSNMVPAGGAVRSVVNINSTALAEFLRKESGDVLSQTANANGDEIKKTIETLIAQTAMGTVTDMVLPGKSMISGIQTAQFANAEQPAKVVDQMVEMMKTNLKGMETSMGSSIQVTMDKNVRKVGGVPVHHIAITLPATPNTAGPEAAFLKSFFGNGQIVMDAAPVGDKLIYAFGEGVSIDPVIEAVKSGKGTATPVVLNAEALYGANAPVMMDAKLAPILQALSSSMTQFFPAGQPNPLAMIANGLATAPPVSAAAQWNKQEARATVIIPSSLLVSVGQTVVMMQAQAMQQNMGNGSPSNMGSGSQPPMGGMK